MKAVASFSIFALVFATASAVNCPPDTDEILGKCYTFVDEKASYNRAQERCETKYKGALVSIHDADLNKVLAEVVEEEVDEEGLWIGAYLDHGTWKWEDKQPMNFTVWGLGEPKRNNCVKLAADGFWYSTNCDLKKTYSCQIEPLM